VAAQLTFGSGVATVLDGVPVDSPDSLTA
jgi:hypothetical protein